MEYFLLTILVIYLLYLLIISIEVINNKQLTAHRRAFWVFTFITSPVVGYKLYADTEGRQKIKKPLQ